MSRGGYQKPTKSEVDILQILWKRGPSTVREVQEEIEKQRPFSYLSALKLMQIMLGKGLVEREVSKRAHVYRAAGAEAEAKRDLVGDFMDRAFGGSARELMLHALSAKPRSSEEIDELRKLLDELDAKRE